MRRILLAFVLSASTAFADGKITWERVPADGTAVPITAICKNGMGRMETGGDKKITVLWDGEKKVLSVLHPATKSYEQIDPAKFSLATGQQPAPEAEAKFTNTGKKSKVGKWDCDVYTVKRGDIELEQCIVPWAKAPVKKADLACMKSISDAFHQMGAKDADASHDYDKMPGMPLQTSRDLGDGKKSVTTFKGFEKVEPEKDAFVVPADYAPGGHAKK